MIRVIALESNISSFWTRSHFNRLIIFDETINEMFSRINIQLYAPVNVNPRTPPGRDIAGHLTSTHF